MKRVFFIIATLGIALMAAEGRYEITPTVSGILPEGNTDLKKQLSVGLRVGQYFDNEFINKIESGVEFTSTGYENQGPGTGKRQALITRYFVHGIKEFEVAEDMYFYALAGVGYENIRKKARYGNNDSPYGNYGVGVRYAVTDDFYLRTEIRHAIKLHSGHGDNNLFATFGVSYALGQKEKISILPTNIQFKSTKKEAVEKDKISIDIAQPKENIEVSENQAKYVPTQTVEVETKALEELESDNDVIADNKSLHPNTSSKFKIDHIQSVTLKINFTSGKADIPDSFKHHIEAVAEILKNDTDYKIIIEGHTDSIGSKESNLILSEQRAKSVAKELIDLGVNESRIVTEWFGSEKPVATNKSAEGRAENRRIEVIFVK
ncbi:MAG: OmpA family protein [Campylobacteraceae bacterium]|jgi:OOP family OmpA-OmpF porin|nr:OmpA family protein [Campylobacteraceae bacterium]